MTRDIKYLGAKHPAQRISSALKAEMVAAQNSVVSEAFSNADDFCLAVLADLKLSIKPSAKLKDLPPDAVSDLDFAELVRFFEDLPDSADLPESARQLHATNFARRAQLLRAFSDPDEVLTWVTEKVAKIVDDLPKEASDIEVGRNPGDVLDPYLLAATQSLLCEGDFRAAISATVTHKALMILEGLMGHLHEEVIGRMRGNVRNPEPRSVNAELLDYEYNPFPGADVVQPPWHEGDTLKLHQIKSKTGTMNSSGGKRLAEQMRTLRMAYNGAELFSHSLVGNTLRGHRSMGGMLRVEPSLVVLVGQASFEVLTSSHSGAELLVRVYQAAFELAAKKTGYSVEVMTDRIVSTFIARAEAEAEGYLESVVHTSTNGDPLNLDSRTYPTKRR